jgi:hypothetical protein
MKTLHRRFIVQLLVISIVLYVVLYFVFSRLAIATLPLIVMVALLFAVNSLAFILVTNTKEKKPGGFVYSYMTVSFGRMIICSVFVFSYALTHRHDARAFALTFFGLYFLYTIVEVKALYAFFKA